LGSRPDRGNAEQDIHQLLVERWKSGIDALRLKAARGQPDAQAYLNQFSGAGWTIVGLAVLNQNPPSSGILSRATNVSGRPIASNEIARQLRRLWGFA